MQHHHYACNVINLVNQTLQLLLLLALLILQQNTPNHPTHNLKYQQRAIHHHTQLQQPQQVPSFSIQQQLYHQPPSHHLNSTSITSTISNVLKHLKTTIIKIACIRNMIIPPKSQSYLRSMSGEEQTKHETEISTTHVLSCLVNQNSNTSSTTYLSLHPSPQSCPHSILGKSSHHQIFELQGQKHHSQQSQPLQSQHQCTESSQYSLQQNHTLASSHNIRAFFR
ncbi:hypothetical protein O181_003840 [Austropuccinia psidii MF-1]|uniref:Uncharacterized protein n=1 Tax=Austropuccinia psidii MF-1 TaxID=1389203 RepID=A0A9Q3GEA8_9BASI|nr:hypothetical protein [Austropuccinia psidii MF-1]